MGFVMKVPHDFSQILYSVLLGQTLTGVAVRQSAPVFPEIYVAGFRHVATSQEAFMVKMIEDTPTSFATSTSTQVNTSSFTVSWGGSGPVSGALTFDVFVSDNGGPFTPFQTATMATSAPFHRRGRAYLRLLQHCHRRRGKQGTDEDQSRFRGDDRRCHTPGNHATDYRHTGQQWLVSKLRHRKLERIRSRVRNCILHGMRASQPDRGYSRASPLPALQQMALAFPHPFPSPSNSTRRRL